MIHKVKCDFRYLPCLRTIDKSASPEKLLRFSSFGSAYHRAFRFLEHSLHANWGQREYLMRNCGRAGVKVQ